MSKEALAKIVQRSISDAAFRRQLATDPTGALRGYDLSKDEVSALRSRDASRLTALGVEQRMSKAFTLTDGTSGSPILTTDLSSGAAGNAVLTAGTDANGNAVIPSDPMDARPDLTGGASAEPRDVAPTWIGEGSGATGVLSSEPRDVAPVDISGTSVEPRDVAPTWIGEYNPAVTGNEPRDIAPVDIGDNAPLSNVMTTDDAASTSGAQTADFGTDEGQYIPSVGYAGHEALTTDGDSGGAQTPGDAGDGPNISH